MEANAVRLQLRRSRIKESADHWMTASEERTVLPCPQGHFSGAELVSVRFNQAGTLADVAGAPLDLGDLRPSNI
jgi:hypothetical protein